MKKQTCTIISIVLLVLLITTSCHRNDDFDLKPGTFKLFSPISINGDALNGDYWTLTDDSLIIVRDNEIVYADRVVWHGRRLDLFPFRYNPYYSSSMSGGEITTIWWGFYYHVSGLPTFTLQREP